MRGKIKSGVEEGAELVIGGKVIPRFEQTRNQATVFASITRDMRIAKEEIFGPVLSILAFWAMRRPLKSPTAFRNSGSSAYVNRRTRKGPTVWRENSPPAASPVNTVSHDPFAPFWWVQTVGDQSGRQDLRAAGVLEPKAIIG